MLNPFIKEKLEYILDHTNTITIYFAAIHQPADFNILPDGKKSFDAIISRLQALGENFKKIEKLQIQVAEYFGFKLTNHILELYGLCPPCQAKAD